MWKLSEFYTTKFVDSYFHQCGHDYPHDCVDANVVGTVDVEDDPVALYLEYYDCGSSH